MFFMGGLAVPVKVAESRRVTILKRATAFNLITFLAASPHGGFDSAFYLSPASDIPVLIVIACWTFCKDERDKA